MNKILCLIIIAGFLTSCGFVRDEEVDGKYHIFATDNYDEPCLGYEVNGSNYICLVPPKIISYYHSSDYIVVKRAYSKEQVGRVEYYVVPIVPESVEVFPEDIILGPLDAKEFKKQQFKLNLVDLNFTDI